MEVFSHTNIVRCTNSQTLAKNGGLMSFSGDVKEELVKLESSARHCQIAELAAIVLYSNAIKYSDKGEVHLEIQSETLHLENKSSELISKILGINKTEAFGLNKDKNKLLKLLETIKYAKGDFVVNPVVLKSMCCKRAFLRGVFLGNGSMSNPEKGYHLEFVCENQIQAEQLIDTLAVFDIEAKMVQRKKYQIVYIKESEGIVELLNVIGAHVSLMKLENLRILKDMRNSINRRVNCEAANITKTVNAATKQIEDIKYINEHYGFDNLSDNLREVAQLRLEYPDATLKELGQYLVPAVGKSGVNHRLRKLCELAEELRAD